SKRIALEVQREADVVPVRGDLTRLQQVLENLLTNAIKFTSGGGRVTVVVRRAGPSAELVVRDTGIGIAPDVLPHVFERFQQGDPSIAQQHGGLGLGLAIARHLVEMHGGTVEARSDGVRRGAAFTVRVPLEVESEKETASPAVEIVRTAPEPSTL